VGDGTVPVVGGTVAACRGLGDGSCGRDVRLGHARSEWSPQALSECRKLASGRASPSRYGAVHLGWAQL
jgi:hypothetical protein